MAVKCPVKEGMSMALLSRWTLCFQSSLLTENRGCQSLLSTVNSSAGGLPVWVLSCQFFKSLFKWHTALQLMALNQCGISIFTPTEGIFTRHNSIQSWHLVIAIKHEGHPFYYFFFLYKLSEHNFIHIKKIICNLIWPTHTHLISPTSQASQHVTHTFTTRIYKY